jgi:poly(3-hydroxybutyrate) depolymerase
MRKTVTLILCSLLAVGSAMADTKVVYVNDSGTNPASSVTEDELATLGTTPETAFKSFAWAARAVKDADPGIIVVNGKFTQSSNFVSSYKHSGTTIITQVYDGKDYRSEGSLTISKGCRFQLTGPTTFENININCTVTSNNFYLVIANFYPITIGENVTATGFTNTQIANSLCVLGGCQDNTNYKNANSDNPEITVKSGELMIVGFNRGTASNFGNYATSTGTATMNISGGTIHNVYAGSVSDGLSGGAATMNISGGKFVDHVYMGTMGVNVAAGDATLNITGGDFSNCVRINCSKYSDTQTAVANIKDAGDSEWPALLKLAKSDFEINTNYKVPGYLFTTNRTFEDENGTTLPYRLYAPADYTEVSYPLVLFLHGNGAVGNDNTTQLESDGVNVLLPIVNSTTPSIIVAPQSTSENAWVGTYPGSASYDKTGEMSASLTAAKALLDNVVTTYNADEKRIYAVGASNGAAGCYDLMVHYPSLLAASVPVAGCPDATNADAITSELAVNNIWTMHGDADETLSVDGTRGLVKAIEAVNHTGEIKYTEFSGLDHNTIWAAVGALTNPTIDEWMFGKTNGNLTAIESIVNDNGNAIKYEVNNKSVSVSANGQGKVTVYDISGRAITSATLIDGKAQVNVAMPSVYILKVDTTNGNFVKKLMVK